jgi:hypothetical protein
MEVKNLIRRVRGTISLSRSHGAFWCTLRWTRHLNPRNPRNALGNNISKSLAEIRPLLNATLSRPRPTGALTAVRHTGVLSLLPTPTLWADPGPRLSPGTLKPGGPCYPLACSRRFYTPPSWPPSFPSLPLTHKPPERSVSGPRSCATTPSSPVQ